MDLARTHREREALENRLVASALVAAYDSGVEVRNVQHEGFLNSSLRGAEGDAAIQCGAKQLWIASLRSQ
jgi:hypothetical protein